METRSVEDKARIIVAKNMTEPSINFLLGALYQKNRLTYTHSINVGYLAAQVCIRNRVPKTTAKQIVRGALLHDIGKLFISADILTKKDALTPEEYDIIKGHTIYGVEIIKNVAPSLVSDIVVDIIENHHEDLNGGGYKGKTNISYYSQLIHALDMYDALTSDRPYRKSFPMDYSVNYLLREGVSDSIVSSIVDCKIK